jgi:hypothetical protein
MNEQSYQTKIIPWDIPEIRVKISKIEQLRQLILRKLDEEDERDLENDPPFGILREI